MELPNYGLATSDRCFHGVGSSWCGFHTINALSVSERHPSYLKHLLVSILQRARTICGCILSWIFGFRLHINLGSKYLSFLKTACLYNGVECGGSISMLFINFLMQEEYMFITEILEWTDPLKLPAISPIKCNQYYSLGICYSRYIVYCAWS